MRYDCSEGCNNSPWATSMWHQASIPAMARRRSHQQRCICYGLVTLKQADTVLLPHRLEGRKEIHFRIHHAEGHLLLHSVTGFRVNIQTCHSSELKQQTKGQVYGKPGLWQQSMRSASESNIDDSDGPGWVQDTVRYLKL